MDLRKTYMSAFVVEESKLTRLLSVIKNTFDQDGAFYKEVFEAGLTGAKTVRTESLQHIVELDNSERSRVVRLVINCLSEPKTSGDPAHMIEVDFDGHRPVDVTISVASGNERIASEVMSVAEEQVERMLERGLMYRLFTSREAGTAAIMFTAVAGGLMAMMVGLIAAGPDPQIYKTMWLTSSDLAEIQPIVQDARTLAPEQATDILARQLRNVTAREGASPFSKFFDWRVAMILLPAVIAIGSLVALAPCYPRAVFLWGDAKDWYQRLAARRKWIWNVVVATLLIGIIANLAVFAFGSLISVGST